ncbi:type II toxin-antitoxin system death-on-curing family toxin [Candidatus Thorarchaeota archaeon]|nr:MAG: type II toxin-antitoxin system death-on-curing family toxin [Candidatus Thorarchaeota archaeon]
MRLRYLTFDEVLAIHDRMIGVFGGEDGILSEGALENCVALPMMSVFGVETSQSLWAKAAELLYCIVTRHPFVDGNKRTGWAAAKVFLRLNGYALTAQAEEAEEVVLRVVQGQTDCEALAEWMEGHASPA